MKLYFGNLSSIASTILIIGVLMYIGTTISKINEITTWGKRIAVLALWGLLICIFAAARDGYILSVQAAMNSSITPGLFTAYSTQSRLASMGGAVIAISSISSIFIKKQPYRKAMFFVLSGMIIFKTLLIEISRIIL
ncbi:MAG: hypothetical protein LIR50_02005 [Bacillota bacterium]|nr:hypothetical protein [Bacillota bacterium]